MGPEGENGPQPAQPAANPNTLLPALSCLAKDLFYLFRFSSSVVAGGRGDAFCRGAKKRKYLRPMVMGFSTNLAIIPIFLGILVKFFSLARLLPTHYLFCIVRTCKSNFKK